MMEGNVPQNIMAILHSGSLLMQVIFMAQMKISTDLFQTIVC